MTDQITLGSHMNHAPQATTPQMPPVTIASDHRTSPQSARRSTRASQSPSLPAHHAAAAAAAAAHAPYARKESGMCSGYQIVRMSGGGQRRSPGKESAAAIAAPPT